MNNELQEQIASQAEKFETEVDHLFVLLELEQGISVHDSQRAHMAVSQAKRVRRSVNRLIQTLAGSRDGTQCTVTRGTTKHLQA